MNLGMLLLLQHGEHYAHLVSMIKAEWPSALVAPGPQRLPAAAVQIPVQAAVVRLGLLPNLPAGQREHCAAPPPLNVPGGHWTWVEAAVPAGHANPGGQTPGQGDPSTGASPVWEKVPGGHNTTTVNVNPDPETLPSEVK